MHLPFVTIDPHDAKDFDDAVCMTDEGGKTTLWVAIADVAHYVQKIQDSTMRQSRPLPSIYLIRATNVTSSLADDLCSLRADVDKMVIEMQLNAHGDHSIRCS